MPPEPRSDSIVYGPICRPTSDDPRSSARTLAATAPSGFTRNPSAVCACASSASTSCRSASSLPQAATTNAPRSRTSRPSAASHTASTRRRRSASLIPLLLRTHEAARVWRRWRASFLQQRGPVDDERDGCRRGLLREHVYKEALAVGGNVVRVHRAKIAHHIRARIEQR